MFLLQGWSICCIFLIISLISIRNFRTFKFTLGIAVGSIDFLTVSESNATIFIMEETVEWVEFLTELHIAASNSLLGSYESLFLCLFLLRELHLFNSSLNFLVSFSLFLKTWLIHDWNFHLLNERTVLLVFMMMMIFKSKRIVYSCDGRSIWEYSWTIILVNGTIELIPSSFVLRFFKSLSCSNLVSLSFLLGHSHFTFLLVFNIIFLIYICSGEFVDACNRSTIWEDLLAIIVVVSAIELVPSFLVISSGCFCLFFSCNSGICRSDFSLILIINIILNLLINLISSHRVWTSLRMVFDLNKFIFGYLLRLCAI